MRPFPNHLAALTSFVALTSSLAHAGPYKLPWAPGLAMELTQDCNDSFYADHVGSGKHAWDFANGSHFAVSAAREGVVTHLKASSHAGCETSACVDLANYVVVDHGDGTASVYLHLDGDSLPADVRCGERVRQGQKLATAGSTGWSTGPHLHFQVNGVHHGETRTCECGDDGLACEPDAAMWTAFWSTPKYPSVPVVFDEWSAGECSDRRITLPLSQNVDLPSDTRVARAPRPPEPKNLAKRPLYMLGVGGRTRPTGFNDRSRPLFLEILRPSLGAPFEGRLLR
ncbi:MAG TPA: M23 family metallopeptidase [Polyangiaceae bacterium]|nr:M23 family metallopeptidase [Polyangiaceae bacterium]